MERPIGAVFKVLALSIIMMIVMDTVSIVIDRTTTNRRIENLATVIKDEMSRNNGVSPNMATLFESQLVDIAKKSNSLGETLGTDIITNLNNPVTINGRTYSAVNNSTNVYNYSDNMELVIVTNLEVKSVLFSPTADSSGSFLQNVSYDFSKVYEYDVTALRFLK